ncbi:S8 family serine peptidase [Zavarzinia sp.]|uniref:S8 family serine peptidase n=1 Tax=Zavarzinia sp. TaxID=2027920 RepID=UPI003569635B
MLRKLCLTLCLGLFLVAAPHHHGTALAKDGGGEGGEGGGGDGGGGSSGGGSGSGGSDHDSGRSGSGGDDSSGSNSGGDDGSSDDGSGDDSGSSGSGGDDAADDDSGGDDTGGIADGGGAPGASGSGHDGPHIAGELTMVGSAATEAELRPFGVTIVETRDLPTLGLHILRLRVGSGSAENTLDNLRRAFPDAEIALNSLYRPHGSDAAGARPPITALNWHRRLTNWSHDAAGCATGRIIGVIDTALAPGIGDLAGVTVESKSTIDGGYEARPDAHGSYVVSLLAGPTVGVVPGARVLHAAAVEHIGKRDFASATSIATALDWLAERGAAVVNISLAGPDNALLRRAVEQAAATGMVLVAPSGNGGAASPAAYPAAYPQVIAVAATDRLNRVWQGSSRPATTGLGAPGVGLLIGDATVSGTSFASPLAAGAALTAIAAGGDPRPRLLAEAHPTDVEGIRLLQFDGACFQR